jgi:hypothetical protein
MNNQLLGGVSDKTTDETRVETTVDVMQCIDGHSIRCVSGGTYDNGALYDVIITATHVAFECSDHE